jgi:hypothetical protein
MQIQPYFGDQPITASNVEVRVNPDDRRRANALVSRTSRVQGVNSEETFSEARQAAGELKAMADEIESSRKLAKIPFSAVGRAIDDVAQGIAHSVKIEQDRILGLLAAYVAKLEAARKEEERIEAELRRVAQEEADRKVKEAQEALKAARDEGERLKAQNRVLQEQLAASLADDVEELGQDLEPQRGLVPGGRVNHVYEFELVDVAATVKAGCWRLVRWELDIMACRDSVKSQVEMLPADQEPTLPGIRITKRINVSVKAASRIK